MFSTLHIKSKAIIIISFMLISLVIGFIVFTLLNTFFPKNVQAENDNKIQDIKKEEVKKEDETKEIQSEDVTQDKAFFVENEKPAISINKSSESDVDLYVSNIYKVGFDIEAGIYKVLATEGESGQYTIANTDDKDSVSFYDGKLFFNFRYVELKEGEVIYLVDADIVSEKNNERYSSDRFVSGQYKVGFDIQPGSYMFVPTGQAGYLEVSDTPLGETLFSKYVESSVELELKEGQYLTISGVNIVK